MKYSITPSANCAFAHRRMAMSAFRANPSLSSRLARYNTNMAIALTRKAVGGVQ